MRALSRAGFAIYRQTADATILERGLRAVTVRTCSALDGGVLMDLRRMAGLSWRELDAAVEEVEATTCPEASRPTEEVSSLRGPGPASTRAPDHASIAGQPAAIRTA